MVQSIDFFEAPEAVIVMSKRQQYLGEIKKTGRNPGAWISADTRCIMHPTAMMEIANKCVETRRAIDSTRNLRGSSQG